MYSQRQGCCSLNLVQHAEEGGDENANVAKQGLISSLTLHVCASVTNNSPTKRNKNIATQEIITFFIVQCCEEF